MWRYLFVGAILVSLSGCAFWPRSTLSPIPTIQSTPGSPTAPTLVVFLPGRGDRLKDFERRGLSEEMARSGVRADWVAVDAHLGYYRSRLVIERLREDVIEPARARGYRRIVVVGVSLGGLGGLLGERDHPGLFDAIVLIAPYLGDRKAMFDEIQNQGGPVPWAAAHSPAAGDIGEQVWSFLGQRVTTLPPTWLAYGSADRFAVGHRLLAPLLQADRVKISAGGHDWPTWQALWRDLCQHSDLFAAERRSPGQ